jgi:hypothetical protein
MTRTVTLTLDDDDLYAYLTHYARSTRRPLPHLITRVLRIAMAADLQRYRAMRRTWRTMKRRDPAVSPFERLCVIRERRS